MPGGMAVNQSEVRWERNGFQPIRGEVHEEWLSVSYREYRRIMSEMER